MANKDKPESSKYKLKNIRYMIFDKCLRWFSIIILEILNNTSTSNNFVNGSINNSNTSDGKF